MFTDEWDDVGEPSPLAPARAEEDSELADCPDPEDFPELAEPPESEESPEPEDAAESKDFPREGP